MSNVRLVIYSSVTSFITACVADMIFKKIEYITGFVSHMHTMGSAWYVNMYFLKQRSTVLRLSYLVREAYCRQLHSSGMMNELSSMCNVALLHTL